MAADAGAPARARAATAAEPTPAPRGCRTGARRASGRVRGAAVPRRDLALPPPGRRVDPVRRDTAARRDAAARRRARLAWLPGAPHVFFFPREPARLAGNTLVWATESTTYRLEGPGLSKADALALARSLADTP